MNNQYQKLIEYGRLKVFTVQSKSAATITGESAHPFPSYFFQAAVKEKGGDSNHGGPKFLRSSLLSWLQCRDEMEAVPLRGGGRGAGMDNQLHALLL